LLPLLAGLASPLSLRSLSLPAIDVDGSARKRGRADPTAHSHSQQAAQQPPGSGRAASAGAAPAATGRRPSGGAFSHQHSHQHNHYLHLQQHQQLTFAVSAAGGLIVTPAPAKGRGAGARTGAAVGTAGFALASPLGGGHGGVPVTMSGSAAVAHRLLLGSPLGRSAAAGTSSGSGRPGFLTSSTAGATAGAVGLEAPEAGTQPLPTVLARYTSLLDETRPGVASPASFSREDHRGALLTLQRGLERMSGQRRAEEEHMACTTRVKPAKHPRGGYMYVDIDTGEWTAALHARRCCMAGAFRPSACWRYSCCFMAGACLFSCNEGRCCCCCCCMR
jgi:hypothetical protein